MGMRGIHTQINDIRRKIFTEVARLSYNYKNGDLSEMDLVPYRIIPGEISTYRDRDSVFLERAIMMERPCAEACRTMAIITDEYGRAEINQGKCVSCEMCLANCPFGAIADKTQIFQSIQAIKSEKI